MSQFKQDSISIAIEQINYPFAKMRYTDLDYQYSYKKTRPQHTRQLYTSAPNKKEINYINLLQVMLGRYYYLVIQQQVATIKSIQAHNILTNFKNPFSIDAESRYKCIISFYKMSTC